MNRTTWILITLYLHLCQRLCIGNIARLVVSSTYEGRLEIYHDEEWGTVCDDEFDYRDATVACRMLGYSGGEFLNHSHGPGIGRIWLDNLQCSGSETSLANCGGNSWGSHDCHHGEDVSVRCNAHAITSTRISTSPTTQTVRRTTTSSTTTTRLSSTSSSSSTATLPSLSSLAMKSNSSMSCLLDATTTKAIIIGAAAAAVIIIILLVVDITVRCKGRNGKEVTEGTSNVVENGKNELCLADIGVEENAEDNLYVDYEDIELNIPGQSPSTSELYENCSVQAKRK